MESMDRRPYCPQTLHKPEPYGMSMQDAVGKLKTFEFDSLECEPWVMYIYIYVYVCMLQDLG